MRRNIARIALVVGLSVAAAQPGQAIEPYTYTIGALGGIGGSWDVEPDPGYDNPTFQLNLGMVVDTQTLLVVRIGELDFEDVDGLPGDPTLQYATISGEYRFVRDWYDSGLYLGLGAYDYGGDFDGDTGVGLAFGSTGDFEMNRWSSLLVELSAHWADVEDAQFFVMGHIGVGFRW